MSSMYYHNINYSTMKDDLENPLLQPHNIPSGTTCCLGILKNATIAFLQWLVTCLFLSFVGLVLLYIGTSILATALPNYMLEPDVKVNINSAITINSFNVSTNPLEIKGVWDISLISLNKDVAASKYEARTWLYCESEYISSYDSKGTTHQALEQGSFTMDKKAFVLDKLVPLYGSPIIDIDDQLEDFTRDKGLVFDLFMEANVTYYNHGLWSDRTVFLMVDCKDLKIQFPLNQTNNNNSIGMLFGGVKSCHVETFATKSEAQNPYMILPRFNI